MIARSIYKLRKIHANQTLHVAIMKTADFILLKLFHIGRFFETNQPQARIKKFISPLEHLSRSITKPNRVSNCSYKNNSRSSSMLSCCIYVCQNPAFLNEFNGTLLEPELRTIFSDYKMIIELTFSVAHQHNDTLNELHPQSLQLEERLFRNLHAELSMIPRTGRGVRRRFDEVLSLATV